MTRMGRGVLALALVVVMATACSEKKQFPTGHWQATSSTGAVLVMNWDSNGTWTAKTATSASAPLEDLSAGTFDSDETTLTFESDGYCAANGEAEEGTYSWKVAADQLTLTAEQDGCESRRSGLDGTTFDPLD